MKTRIQRNRMGHESKDGPRLLIQVGEVYRDLFALNDDDFEMQTILFSKIFQYNNIKNGLFNRINKIAIGKEMNPIDCIPYPVWPVAAYITIPIKEYADEFERVTGHSLATYSEGYNRTSKTTKTWPTRGLEV